MQSHDPVFYESCMQRCIELALQAKSRGDSPVGAIVVRNHEIIAEGIEGGKTHQDITFHAEIEAIRQARIALKTADLSECVMFTTHEPCIMCAYVIRHHGIQKVVFGVRSAEIGGSSSKYPLLLDTSISRWKAAPVLVEGILEQACNALKD